VSAAWRAASIPQLFSGDSQELRAWPRFSGVEDVSLPWKPGSRGCGSRNAPVVDADLTGAGSCGTGGVQRPNRGRARAAQAVADREARRSRVQGGDVARNRQWRRRVAASADPVETGTARPPPFAPPAGCPGLPLASGRLDEEDGGGCRPGHRRRGRTAGVRSTAVGGGRRESQRVL
jgi:hypothetical protein